MKDLKQTILGLAKRRKAIRVADVLDVHSKDVSRQYAQRLIRELITEGRLVKVGTTRKTFYALPEFIETAESARGSVFKRRFKNVDFGKKARRERQPPGLFKGSFLFRMSLHKMARLKIHKSEAATTQTSATAWL